MLFAKCIFWEYGHRAAVYAYSVASNVSHDFIGKIKYTSWHLDGSSDTYLCVCDTCTKVVEFVL